MNEIREPKACEFTGRHKGHDWGDANGRYTCYGFDSRGTEGNPYCAFGDHGKKPFHETGEHE